MSRISSATVRAERAHAPRHATAWACGLPVTGVGTLGINENSVVVLEVFDAIERRDQKRIARLFHPDVELHWPRSLPYGGVFRPSSPLRPTWGETWIPLQPTEAEWGLSPRFVAAEGNEVVVLWHQRGLSPGGERLDTEVLGLYEVRDGKLVRAQMFYFDASAAADFLARAQS
jgi:ketosteroid isomerase-like protein